METHSGTHSKTSDVDKAAVSESENVALPTKETESIEQLDTDRLDPVAVKKLIWKCDIHVIPPLFVLFLLAFLDRTNIGNANVQGLSDLLKLTGPQYNIALEMFFIPYMLLEVPSNLILKKIAPSTWLSAIMVFWGMIFFDANDFGASCGNTFHF